MKQWRVDVWGSAEEFPSYEIVTADYCDVEDGALVFRKAEKVSTAPPYVEAIYALGQWRSCFLEKEDE